MSVRFYNRKKKWNQLASQLLFFSFRSIKVITKFERTKYFLNKKPRKQGSKGEGEEREPGKSPAFEVHSGGG